jgi:hypothetical protein
MFIELGQHENPDPECGSMCLNSHVRPIGVKE